VLEHPSIAIGLGMLISLILTESVGVTAGGLIVPGYIALNLHNPYMVLFTFLISLFTLLILNLLSKFIIIYGKRRLVFCLLLSFILGSIVREFPLYLMESNDIGNLLSLRNFEGLNFMQSFIVEISYQLVRLTEANMNYDYLIDNPMIYVGYLIPGLMASWMDKQGVIKTSATIIIIASVINLILMVLGKYV
tara:strand:- start:424 stop:999 length:576 start_codon:yes stop_codon:yes gene_type:complete